MLRSIFSLLAVTLFSVAAQAHAGDHSGFNLMEALRHLFAEPLHAGIIIAAVIALVGWRIYSHRNHQS